MATGSRETASRSASAPAPSAVPPDGACKPGSTEGPGAVGPVPASRRHLVDTDTDTGTAPRHAGGKRTAAGTQGAAGPEREGRRPGPEIPRYVAYERVSTARQGASGLGLDAQRAAIDTFAASRGATVLARFTEIESGRLASRPELAMALQLARLTGATLVIARLDRLSRNAAFLLALRDSGVAFLAVDMPEANDLTVGIMALVAEAEREAISRRTREALAAAKARGTRLGNPNGAAALRRAGKGAVALRAAVTANADAHAKALAPVIADLRARGHTTLRALATELTARGMQTRRGGSWHVSNVRNLLKRLERA